MARNKVKLAWRKPVLTSMVAGRAEGPQRAGPQATGVKS